MREKIKLKKLLALGLLFGCAAVQAAPADDVECNKCVDASDLSVDAIAGRHLKIGVVSTDKIANKSVSQIKLGRKSVSNGKIQDGAVTLNKLSPELAAAIAKIDELEDYIEKLQAYIEVDENTNPSQPVVRVIAANFQIVNGEGASNTINGTGNLIIGYDEASVANMGEICSHGLYTREESCQEAGNQWALNHKSGSHNLVIGASHRYSQYSGLVVGLRNTINAEGASVTAGNYNIASGNYASVSGGIEGTAVSSAASVSGGRGNTAWNAFSSVSGGLENTANGSYSNISGGRLNETSGTYSSVSGGYTNRATGNYSSVSGGEDNYATGDAASVSGGFGRNAANTLDWAAGALFQDF